MVTSWCEDCTDIGSGETIRERGKRGTGGRPYGHRRSLALGGASDSTVWASECGRRSAWDLPRHSYMLQFFMHALLHAVAVSTPVHSSGDCVRNVRSHFREPVHVLRSLGTESHSDQSLAWDGGQVCPPRRINPLSCHWRRIGNVVYKVQK